MQRIAITQLAAVGLFIIGIVIGAGVLYATTNTSGISGTKTETFTLAGTQTMTLTSIRTVTSTQTLSTATLVLVQTSTVTIIRTTTSAFAQVSAQVVSCTRSANGTNYCAVTLTNSGTAGAGVTGCHISISGTSATGRVTGQTTIAAGTQSTAYCSAAGPVQASGSQAPGFFSLNDGSTVVFSGIWS
jgi:hypothetical protein